MSNRLFNELNHVRTASQNPMMQFQNFLRNPMQFMLQSGINIPPQYMNDPKGAVEYLMRNGQMSQEQFNRLAQMASQMGVTLR